MSIRIDIAGDDTALPDLREWLSNERDLRGRLRQRTKPAQPGTMGSGTELVIQLTDLGLAGVNTVIAAITAWLAYRQRQPRAARTTVTVTRPTAPRTTSAARTRPHWRTWPWRSPNGPGATMIRLPDPERSRAFLFGAATYRYDDFPDLPAVADNLRDLRAALTPPLAASPLSTARCSSIRRRPWPSTSGSPTTRTGPRTPCWSTSRAMASGN